MLVIVQGNPNLMVELDENNRAVDTVIERAHRVTVADPGEIGFRQMRLHFLESDLGVTGPDTADVRLNHDRLQRSHLGRAARPASEGLGAALSSLQGK